MDTMICTKCNLPVPFPGGFYRDNRIKRGHRASCKECDKKVKRSDEALARAKARRYDTYRPRLVAKGYFNTPEYKAKKAMYERARYERLKDNPDFKKRRYRSVKRHRQTPRGKLAMFRYREKRRSKVGQVKLSLPEWQMILDAFENACAYCFSPENITVDHFIPVDLGGQTAFGNIVPACKRCNSSKRNLLPKDWCSNEQLRRVLDILASLLSH